MIKGVGDGFAFIWDHFLGPVLGATFDAVTTFFQVLSDVFKTIVDNAVVATILEGIGIAIGVIVGALTGMMTLTAVLGAVIIAAKIAFIALTSPITWVIAGITALIAVIVLCIKHWDQICKFVGFVVGEIVKFVSNMVGEVGKFFENLWNIIVGIFAGVGKWFGDKFRGAWNGITGAFSGVTGWASDRWNDITKAFSNAWQVFSDIGKNIWNGLKNGIGNIANNMKNMFTGAVDNVKKFLGIHSPSKLFMGIGDYMGQGLNIGFEDNFDSMIKSADELAHEIDSKMQINIPKPADIDIDIDRKNSVIGGYIDDMKSAPFILNIDGEKVFEGVVNRANTQTFLRDMGIFDI